jgi:hypothetical protein
MGDEARKRAVEAVARAIWARYTNSPVVKPELRGITWDNLLDWSEASPRMAELVQLGRDEASDAIAAYERAMADAGWRMVRDCGEAMHDQRRRVDVPHATDKWQRWACGCDACRAAMLGEGE